MNFVRFGCRLLATEHVTGGLLSNIKRHFSSEGGPGFSKLRKIIQDIPKEKLNERDGRGWTALMLAAKEGDQDAIELLLERGSEPLLKTTTGHTAYDIAVFWRKESAAKLLKPVHIEKDASNFFAFDGIHRNSHRREQEDWLARTIISDTSEFILLHNAKPLVGYEGNPSPRSRKTSTRPSLLFKTYSDVNHLIEENYANVVYIGDWDRASGEGRAHGTKHVERSVFAVDVSGHEEGYLIKAMFEGSEVLSPFPGFLRLSRADAGVVAQARSVLDWQRRNQFCPSCGQRAKLVNSGYKLVCSNKSCFSHKGENNTSYPRVDPTVICAVVSRDNEYCLLGRQKLFPNGMYSCLAGFVEPGESFEQACRREVFEEVGVHVSKVTYHSSQPWPMPSTLMVGCITQANHDRDIKMDAGELEDAQWFSRQETAMMLLGVHREDFFLPPQKAIAHRLVNDWLVNTAFD